MPSPKSRPGSGGRMWCAKWSSSWSRGRDTSTRALLERTFIASTRSLCRCRLRRFVQRWRAGRRRRSCREPSPNTFGRTGYTLLDGDLGCRKLERHALRLHLFPLIRCEYPPHLPQHSGVGFLQLRARLGDTVDLRQHLGVVGRIGGHQRLQNQLFFLEGRLQVDELQAMLLENVIDTFLLLSGEIQSLDRWKVGG